MSHRFNVVQLNVGGLSTFRLQELQHWASGLEADILVLTETRWSFASEWQLPHWHCIHSGTATDKADGIMVLIRTSVCPADDIGVAELAPGRLIHVRIHFHRRSFDRLCCYQYTDDRSSMRLRQRAAIWNHLDSCVANIPNRNTLLVTGDLDSSVRQDGRHVGTSTFTWNHGPCTGPQHRDMQTLHALLHKYDLCVLNIWNATNGPSFVNGLHASRIDHCLMRCVDADGFSKDVVYMPTADVLPVSGAMHIPMLCRVKKI